MAGSKSDYLENKILDHRYGGPDFARPATVYVALFTAAPSDAGGGTEVSTGAWSNYARVAVTNNNVNFPAAAGGSKSNGTAISFGTATIPGAAPTVVAFGIFDAAAAGNLLDWGDLTVSKVVSNGDPVQFPAGALTITED
jgi:hypothetical protein